MRLKIGRLLLTVKVLLASKIFALEGASTQSKRRNTVKGRITLPYSLCLKSPRSKSAMLHIKLACSLMFIYLLPLP